MTALRPIENRRVRGVASQEYPSNRICAHPECTEKVDLRPSGEPTVHHIFAASKIKSRSYFVAIEMAKGSNGDPVERIIPHAVGLCGSGTTGHHGDVEEHRAWIRLNDEGHYEWWDRYEGKEPTETDWIDPATGIGWVRVGLLNPQPGSVEGKPKRRRQAVTPEERKARVNYTVKTPKDEENVIPELVDAAREALHEEMGWDDDVPAYFVITAALSALLQSRTSGRRRK